MSKNGEDDAKEKTVNFESLELDQDEGEEPSKVSDLMKYLKETLDEAQYNEALAKLGVKQDLSNAELLEAFKKLIDPKKPEEEEEEDDDEKKAAAEEEGEKPDRAAFMKECMAEGKDIKTCTEEFNKKYPEPEKEEGTPDELAKDASEEVKAEMKKLDDRIAELEGEKALAEVATEVEKLVTEKHLAPVQRDAIVKLSAKMSPEDRDELLGFFRATQTLNVHNDAGIVTSLKPGEVAGNDLTVERKKELIELHGLSGLIMDKADRSRPWAKELNN